jgi:ferric enterobactin receptor
MQYLVVRIITLLVFIFPLRSWAQNTLSVKGKVLDEQMKPVAFATIKLLQPEIITMSQADGSFSLSVPAFQQQWVLQASYVGKATITQTLNEAALKQPLVIILRSLSLKLPAVEVNGVRKSTTASNSSILFDREAIEQTQPLSIVNVLNYLPGQTILKPVVSIQGVQPILMRTALEQGGSLEQQLNNAFGVNIQIDGNTISNNANMQATNPGFMSLGSANDIQHPESGSVLNDRAKRNGTLYNSYSSITANNGIDLRQIPAENIESIEVISGVASVRYGDYTTGVVIVNRQAGITPWRAAVRTNEGTQNVGITKGFQLPAALGTVNFSLDYLHSNDDPRNKIKSYERVGGGLLWTYRQKQGGYFKNTLSIDYSTTLDRTKFDADESRERMAKFSNTNLRISNRSEWIVKKPWLYNVSFNASFSRSREESYDQYRINGTVLPVADALETSTYEGYHAQGYYLAVHHIVGIPVNASARLEAGNIFHLTGSTTYRLTLGANYSYSANRGPGVLINPETPRFDDMGFKNDRPRDFRDVPEQHNAGVYLENIINTRILQRSFTTSIGIRGDIQNDFFTVSPRISTSWKLTNKISWKAAYGLATKAPALSQISPGHVYFDIPLIDIYDGTHRMYLVHTEVIKQRNNDLKPYRSSTFETGLSWDAHPIQASLFYFNRVSKDGFAQINTLISLTLPQYSYTLNGGQVLYQPRGTDTVYNLTYGRMANGTYNRTDGFELMLSTDKIRALQTSLNVSTAWYRSYYLNATQDVQVPEKPDLSKEAIYGVYKNSERVTNTIKSTIVSTTHIPSLRMAIMFTGELFWMNKTKNLQSAVYPAGYYDRNGHYYVLTPEMAQSAPYAHLVLVPADQISTNRPPFVYPNIHLRLSKEIGNVLRFSFNAYNVFNIRPVEMQGLNTRYYNGLPSFGAELTFTIK